MININLNRKIDAVAMLIQGFQFTFLLIVCAHVVALAKSQEVGGEGSAISAQEVQRLVADAKASGYTLVRFLFNSVGRRIPPQSTIMVPSDEAISAYLLGTEASSQPESERLVQYHILSKLITFQELSRLPKGARLPTLLPGNDVIVTDNTTGRFKINNARLVTPNMCTSTTTISCHGIDNILNLRAFAKAAAPFLPPSHAPVAGHPVIAPPLLAPLFAPTPGAPAVVPSQLSPLLTPGILLPPTTGPPGPTPGPEVKPSAGSSLRGENFYMQRIILAVAGFSVLFAYLYR